MYLIEIVNEKLQKRWALFVIIILTMIVSFDGAVYYCARNTNRHEYIGLIPHTSNPINAQDKVPPVPKKNEANPNLEKHILSLKPRQSEIFVIEDVGISLESESNQTPVESKKRQTSVESNQKVISQTEWVLTQASFHANTGIPIKLPIDFEKFSSDSYVTLTVRSGRSFYTKISYKLTEEDDFVIAETGTYDLTIEVHNKNCERLLYQMLELIVE